ncbi:putative pentatricopeptide repeat-containing protein At1g12700, mitochondrial [Mangifera indica]|uniref:putative pentatricopeptide repeat-containing protein At1g12700, mitochondrial n=1 Tax=Mangifera indica TaxID=29780 RepID=UPI001CFB72E7|nr:putative pentatricopeptide repeat-containing protein At1g12700, mitochondrial [Mangifera indica]
MEGFCQNMVKDMCPNAEEALSALVELFVKYNRVNKSMNLGGFKPSVDVLNALLGAIVKKKRGIKDVVFIYKEMVQAGVMPNVHTLNYVLEVWQLSIEKAWGHSAGVPSGLYRKLGSGFYILLGVVDSLCQTGKIMEAAEAAWGCSAGVRSGLYRKLGSGFYILLGVVDSLCQTGKIMEAAEAAWGCSAGVRSGLYRKLGSGFYILLGVVESLCQTGKIMEAAEVAWGCSAGVRSGWYQKLGSGFYILLGVVESLCQTGKIMEAAEVFHYMSKNGCSPNPSAYNMVIGGMGQVDEAIRLQGLAYSSNSSYTA